MRVVASTAAGRVAVPDGVSLDGVRDIGARFPGALLRPTTVVRAAELDTCADASGATRVWLALESLQVTGSFKVRGALVSIAAELAAGRSRVVAVSAGNHGAGVAYAARVLGAHATICVPRTAPEAKRAKIAAEGAELVLVDTAFYDDAEVYAKDLAAKSGLPFLSPYDDVPVVLGNGASLAFDIVRALGGIVPAHVIAPFGGGGLATGIAWAIGERDGARRVWGAQSEASCAMAMSLESGVAVERLTSDVPTLAEGLEGGISASAFARARDAVAGVVVVSEDAIANAMALSLTKLGVAIEGSSAVALVPLLGGLPAPLRGGDVVSVLTGRNVDADRLAGVLARVSVRTPPDRAARPRST
jgi:threonine dehydratase